MLCCSTMKTTQALLYTVCPVSKNIYQLYHGSVIPYLHIDPAKMIDSIEGWMDGWMWMDRWIQRERELERYKLKGAFIVVFVIAYIGNSNLR